MEHNLQRSRYIRSFKEEINGKVQGREALNHFHVSGVHVDTVEDV